MIRLKIPFQSITHEPARASDSVSAIAKWAELQPMNDPVRVAAVEVKHVLLQLRAHA